MPQKDSVSQTFLVAFILCSVCSVLVATSVVMLRPLQDTNKELDRKRNILAAAGLIQADQPSLDVAALYAEKIRPHVILLSTGAYDESISPESFDERKAIKDPRELIQIPAERDLARIRLRTKHALVYEVYTGKRLETIVLPIHGKGLWSTLWGFLAIKADANTVVGLSFYEHGETPGLGGEVDNPQWKALWPGKKIFAADGSYKLKLIKGKIHQDKPEERLHQVDGLSGSTLTTHGVDALLQYWLGTDGYGPYLTRLRTQNGGEHG